MKIFFITGTDTDCGKTYVTSQLLQYCKKAKYRAEALKPIASGCLWENNILVSGDALELKKHSQLTLDQINPWRYEMPVSPHIASKAEGEMLSAKAIADYCQQFRNLDYLFIEGAGGLLVPLNEEETWLDFLKIMQIPVILVVGLKLGCINHALLTENVLRNHSISIQGWIANAVDEQMLARDENIATLKQHLKSSLLAVIPHAGQLDEFCL